MSYNTPHNWWDVGKFEINSLTIPYCTSRAKCKCSRCETLTNRANVPKSELDISRVSVLDEYKCVLRELNDLNLQDARGAQVRSRSRWCEEGETSSSYFLRPEKKRKSDSWVSGVRLPDKAVVFDIHGLLFHWSSFYKSLFTSVKQIPLFKLNCWIVLSLPLPLTKEHLVRVPFHSKSLLLLSRAWPIGRFQVLMASLRNSIFLFGISLG